MFGRCVCLKPFRIPEKSSGVGKHMANLKMTHLRNHSSWKKKKQTLKLHAQQKPWSTKMLSSINGYFSKIQGLGELGSSKRKGNEGYSPKILFGRHSGKSTSGKPVIWNSGDNRSMTNKTSLTNFFSSFSSLLWENWFPYFSSPISENGSFCSFSGYFSFSSLTGDSVIKSLQVRPKRSELWLQRTVYLE